jgi:hypothetical protein
LPVKNGGNQNAEKAQQSGVKAISFRFLGKIGFFNDKVFGLLHSPYCNGLNEAFFTMMGARAGLRPAPTSFFLVTNALPWSFTALQNKTGKAFPNIMQRQVGE